MSPINEIKQELEKNKSKYENAKMYTQMLGYIEQSELLDKNVEDYRQKNGSEVDILRGLSFYKWAAFDATNHRDKDMGLEIYKEFTDIYKNILNDMKRHLEDGNTLEGNNEFKDEVKNSLEALRQVILPLEIRLGMIEKQNASANNTAPKNDTVATEEASVESSVSNRPKLK